MSSNQRHSRTLLSPSTSSIRSSSVASTPIAARARNSSSVSGLVRTDSISSRRDSHASPRTDSEWSNGSVGKSLSEDEVGKHMHDHSCSHMETVDGQEIMGYELFFGMIFGAEHLESSEEGNQDDAEHARLDHNNMDDGENSAAESLPGAQNMKNLKGFNRSANRTKKKKYPVMMIFYLLLCASCLI